MCVENHEEQPLPNSVGVVCFEPPNHSGAQHTAPTGLMRDGGDFFFYTHAAPIVMPYGIE